MPIFDTDQAPGNKTSTLPKVKVMPQKDDLLEHELILLAEKRTPLLISHSFSTIMIFVYPPRRKGNGTKTFSLMLVYRLYFRKNFQSTATHAYFGYGSGARQ